MKSIVILLVSLLVMASAGKLLLWTDPPDETINGPEVEPLFVETLVPEVVTSFSHDRQIAGIVTASRRTRLAFERAARLQHVSVDDGDQVDRGQILAVVDSRELQARLTEVKAKLKQQMAVLDELKAGPRSETIAATQAELQALSAGVELKKATFDRTSNLFSLKAANAQQLDEARLAWKAASAEKDALSRRLDEMIAGTRVEAIRAQQALVNSLDAQREQLNIALSDSELEAPFSGAIVRRLADEGDFLTPQQPVLELLDDRHLEARFGVPPALAATLDNGSYVVMIADDCEFTGTIRRVVPQLDPDTRTRTIVIDIDAAVADQLCDGQLVHLRLSEQREANGFRFPVTALSPAMRGLWSVYVVKPVATSGRNRGLLDDRTVEILHTNGGEVIARGSLFPGERIVASGLHRVVPGQEVTFASAVVAAAEKE